MMVEINDTALLYASIAFLFLCLFGIFIHWLLVGRIKGKTTPQTHSEVVAEKPASFEELLKAKLAQE